MWYRAISDEEFVLQCALPARAATHIYNNSLLKQHKVKWFWHQKDKEPLKAIEESSNPALQGDALWFKPVRDNASGVYTCMIQYVVEQKVLYFYMIGLEFFWFVLNITFFFLHHSGKKFHVSKLFWRFKQRRWQNVQVITQTCSIFLLAVGI